MPEHSSGELPAKGVETESGVSSVVQILRNVLELASRVQDYPIKGVAGFWLDKQLGTNTIYGSFGAA